MLNYNWIKMHWCKSRSKKLRIRTIKICISSKTERFWLKLFKEEENYFNLLDKICLKLKKEKDNIKTQKEVQVFRQFLLIKRSEFILPVAFQHAKVRSNAVRNASIWIFGELFISASSLPEIVRLDGQVRKRKFADKPKAGGRAAKTKGTERRIDYWISVNASAWPEGRPFWKARTLSTASCHHRQRILSQIRALRLVLRLLFTGPRKYGGPCVLANRNHHFLDNWSS